MESIPISYVLESTMGPIADISLAKTEALNFCMVGFQSLPTLDCANEMLKKLENMRMCSSVFIKLNHIKTV